MEEVLGQNCFGDDSQLVPPDARRRLSMKLASFIAEIVVSLLTVHLTRFENDESLSCATGFRAFVAAAKSVVNEVRGPPFLNILRRLILVSCPGLLRCHWPRHLRCFSF